MGCGRVRPQSELVRFGLAGDTVVPDGPGRGAYLCPDPACLDAAARRGAFNRSFRGPVRVGDETLDLAREWQKDASTR